MDLQCPFAKSNVLGLLPSNFLSGFTLTKLRRGALGTHQLATSWDIVGHRLTCRRPGCSGSLISDMHVENRDYRTPYLDAAANRPRGQLATVSATILCHTGQLTPGRLMFSPDRFCCEICEAESQMIDMDPESHLGVALWVQRW
jgi:hypothetical protein